MNIAEWSLKRSTITWVLTFVFLVVGAMSFNSLSRLEDPAFTIKQVVVLTPYPGATPAEVEEEVSNVMEKAVQELGEVDWIESQSTRGFSMLKVNIHSTIPKEAIPQLFDELRRKVNDYQSQLPPGAGPSIVNDDFGDTYGLYVAITGDGFTDMELYEYAKFLQRELLSVQNVKRIILYGNQPEVIYVEMRREKMAELGISQQDIYNALASKNLPSPSGYVTLGDEYIPVHPTGEFQSEKQFGDLLISSKGTESQSLVFLKDVADIKRGYREPTTNMLRYDGKSAVGLAISTVDGGNVVEMGKGLEVKFKELKPQMPLGMELHAIAMQPEAVTAAINGFIISLGQAVAIVVVVLLIFMGLRSGLIIGFILLLTIMGTFLFMNMKGLILERISLGALVIALGMLVDNAIVVTDGIRMKMKQGVDALTAARDVVGQVGTPLLGATLIAIAAFASIGTSPDSTGEYCASLFWVILISLSLSWFTAVSTTPMLCKTFLKVEKPTDKDGGDVYSGKLFTLYKNFLSFCIRNRWLTTGVVIVLFISSLFGFGFIKQSFFPDSTRPQFYVDFYFPDGTHIDTTVKKLQKAEEWLLEQEDFSHVATEIGGGQPRFLLTYTPQTAGSNIGRIIVDVADYTRLGELSYMTQQALEPMFPSAVVNTRLFVNGPNEGGRVQARITGPDAEVLRQLGKKVRAIMLDDLASRGVRNEWGNPVKVVRPQMEEAQARRVGITRPMLTQALESAVEGTTVGVYREKDELLPIIARAPEQERTDMANLESIQIWSPAAQQMVSAGQVVSSFKTEFEPSQIWRRNRVKMLRIHADADKGLPSELLARVKPKIEQALNVDVEQVLGRTVSPEKWDVNTLKVTYKGKTPLKDMPGYYLSWGGEIEDSARSQMYLIPSVKVFFGLMVLMVIFLFNSMKKTMIIWLTVPLSIIGVTAGLLLLKQPFGFMSLLGLMSLAGMLIKNAIVLIDQIDIELASGKAGFQAIVDSGVSRLIPVSMAALTTVLGLVPLLKDAFFVSMAVTIMFGLTFATVLTLIFVPVLYAMFFKIK
ncbi:MAG: AcrB/AcrD/AcrF family protein [Desulfobacterales bacterium]|nr:AcrB/AcrD/AcrF family protein [Desulfobacterales bacterium]